MVVAEILTGIALVQKSVEFIKSNINTVQDISGIAKQIDGFFLGEEQMNKKQGKGMSIAEQFGSVEKSADDYINRKLLQYTILQFFFKYFSFYFWLASFLVWRNINSNSTNNFVAFFKKR